MYITVERQIKHGPTPGCPGCHCSDDDPKKHSKACRLRFESIYQKGGEGEADAGGPAQSADAGSTAQESEAATGSTDKKGTKRAGEALEAERKGLNENPKTGEKRAAPDEDPTLMELLNGLPTLHDAQQTMCRDLLAAYPEHGRLEAAYDEKTSARRAFTLRGAGSEHASAGRRGVGNTSVEGASDGDLTRGHEATGRARQQEAYRALRRVRRILPC